MAEHQEVQARHEGELRKPVEAGAILKILRTQNLGHNHSIL